MNERELAPGALLHAADDIQLSPGRPRIEVTVCNLGDRPIQVGSHFHFFEVNRSLDFDRAAAFGFHLDIPSGTAARFEPGDLKRVQLVQYGGRQVAFGFNGLTQGSTRDAARRRHALGLARERGYNGAS